MAIFHHSICGNLARSPIIPFLLLFFVWLAPSSSRAQSLPDRFVWMFGWNLSRDSDVDEMTKVLETAAEHGINGAVMSLGLDSLSTKSPSYFRRLQQIEAVCDRHELELIPAIFSIGYGGSALVHDRNLAEGVPVVDAPFMVREGTAELVADPDVAFRNADFEAYQGNRFAGWQFHDAPGEVSFVDTAVKHSGDASLRLENFTANPHGHGRVMQQVQLHPHRCYRLSVWVRTENLKPTNSFMVQVLVGDRPIAPRKFQLSSTGDWQKLTLVFNSLDHDSVRVYAGMWGGIAGKLWVDDWAIEEIGPLNVLRRPGTPVSVKCEDGTVEFVEGEDFQRIEDPQLNPYRADGPVPSIRIPAESRIKLGETLQVSWYHSQVINASQVTICMAEPRLYEIYEQEAKLLAERLHPKRVFLNADEIRMGGTCQACGGRDMAELLGECLTKITEILRRHMPGVEIYVWSDMLDPNHNAHADYHLVNGDFNGSWNHVPEDLILAVWGNEPREESMKFFSGQGFRTLASCYYDADDLEQVRLWFKIVKGTQGARGMMYTPWEKKYELLDDFGDLIRVDF
ncbi:hypothetical protein [Novipirellula artificiosorum]|uniref:CBM-cenC domain-containing protein n=1 Tax=Novipirellula artificiosorum TaxID=2528016 RepID=A0A5C6DZZ8_9BACT|nr:hypothetical protein [Novipirellula artificiosorum]TWU42218.1 hypothetical protein Poly41_05140 [Novipirellula artificiosorum]